jgi:hypothetical protein
MVTPSSSWSMRCTGLFSRTRSPSSAASRRETCIDPWVSRVSWALLMMPIIFSRPPPDAM